MSGSNISILQGYFDEVNNQKHLDLIPKYFSEKFVGHSSPYVGMGLMYDDTSGDKIVIKTINPGAPADGKLMVGDEIVRAQDGDRVWSSYDELRMGGIWGQGAMGTPVTVWVRRGDAELEVTLMRGMVRGFEYPYNMIKTGMGEFFKEFPDLKTRLVSAIESGDMVAYHIENQGHNVRYGRSAVWSEFGFMRIQDGKITDWWSSDDSVPQFRQLGFTILEPKPVKE
jgi:ketosteroid isomerase-like protein